jgi:hypothetical protein
MIDYGQLLEVNKNLETIEVKGGKKYAMVNERVKAFRSICPGGQIVTEILQSADENTITMRASIKVDGITLATGTAYEEKGSSYINKTSHVENCETSAIGRALGFLGIGIDDSMASADEVANAICQQNEIKIKEMAKQPISAIEYKALVSRCNADGVDIPKLCEAYKITGLEELTKGQHAGIHKGWDKVLENCKLQAN